MKTAGGDNRAAQGLREGQGLLEIDARPHAVAMNIGVDDRCYPRLLEAAGKLKGR